MRSLHHEVCRRENENILRVPLWCLFYGEDGMRDFGEGVVFEGGGPFALPAAQRAAATGGSNGVELVLYCLIGDQSGGPKAVRVQMTEDVARDLAGRLIWAANDAVLAKPT
jgi:hypothetical protein